MQTPVWKVIKKFSYALFFTQIFAASAIAGVHMVPAFKGRIYSFGLDLSQAKLKIVASCRSKPIYGGSDNHCGSKSEDVSLAADGEFESSGFFFLDSAFFGGTSTVDLILTAPGFGDISLGSYALDNSNGYNPLNPEPAFNNFTLKRVAASEHDLRLANNSSDPIQWVREHSYQGDTEAEVYFPGALHVFYPPHTFTFGSDGIPVDQANFSLGEMYVVYVGTPESLHPKLSYDISCGPVLYSDKRDISLDGPVFPETRTEVLDVSMVHKD